METTPYFTLLVIKKSARAKNASSVAGFKRTSKNKCDLIDIYTPLTR